MPGSVKRKNGSFIIFPSSPVVPIPKITIPRTEYIFLNFRKFKVKRNPIAESAKPAIMVTAEVTPPCASPLLIVRLEIKSSPMPVRKPINEAAKKTDVNKNKNVDTKGKKTKYLLCPPKLSETKCIIIPVTIKLIAPGNDICIQVG